MEDCAGVVSQLAGVVADSGTELPSLNGTQCKSTVAILLPWHDCSLVPRLAIAVVSDDESDHHYSRSAEPTESLEIIFIRSEWLVNRENRGRTCTMYMLKTLPEAQRTYGLTNLNYLYCYYSGKKVFTGTNKGRLWLPA